VQDGMDPALHRGSHLGQRYAVADALTNLSPIGRESGTAADY